MSNYRLKPLENTEENRQRIIEGTRKKIQQLETKKRQKHGWQPLFVMMAALLVFTIVITPHIQQAFFMKGEIVIEKVVIPGVPYDSLIKSTYIEETNEFIYNTNDGFYRYSVEHQESEKLVDTANIGRIFDYVATSRWLVWPEQQTIGVMQRDTGEIRTIEASYFHSLQLYDDSLYYIGFDAGKPSYFVMDLVSEKETTFLTLTGEGGRSLPAITEKYFVLPQNSNNTTDVHILDRVTHNEIARYSFPYKDAANLLVKSEKIYANLIDENNQSIIGAINIVTGEYSSIESKIGIDAYATNGEQFAISVTQGESNTVQLFELEDDELKRISKLPIIRERIVKPRFTKQGTLIVNGEGQDYAMYIISISNG